MCSWKQKTIICQYFLYWIFRILTTFMKLNIFLCKEWNSPQWGTFQCTKIFGLIFHFPNETFATKLLTWNFLCLFHTVIIFYKRPQYFNGLFNKSMIHLVLCWVFPKKWKLISQIVFGLLYVFKKEFLCLFWYHFFKYLLLLSFKYSHFVFVFLWIVKLIKFSNKEFSVFLHNKLFFF